MLFVVEILGQPDRDGIAPVIERRTHTGPTVTEALRTAKSNLRSPPASAYSFSMRANGQEVGSWRRSDDGRKADILADLQSVTAKSVTAKSATANSATAKAATAKAATAKAATAKAATAKAATSKFAASVSRAEDDE